MGRGEERGQRRERVGRGEEKGHRRERQGRGEGTGATKSWMLRAPPKSCFIIKNPLEHYVFFEHPDGCPMADVSLPVHHNPQY